MKKLSVGILGATGMVGQRFITLLQNHPWFDIVVVAASPSSAGKKYQDAVKGRWKLDIPLPRSIARHTVRSVHADIDTIAADVDLVFSALDLDKETIKTIECQYADRGVAVVSNNSAHRWSKDVPMIIPEVNADHTALIDIQRKKRGWDTGLIAVKPNCSIQSYVAVLTALEKFQPLQVAVTSLQAISGAGKTFADWPEMTDNVIPYIGGEEEKSEKEPMKIWGEIIGHQIKRATKPVISATCIRVPTTDGHVASVAVRFKNKPSKQEIIDAVTHYKNPLKRYSLPSAPRQFITYFGEDNRPQTRLDRDIERGMGIAMGRLREDPLFDWKFVALSHNTIRGAAGGAILVAELLYKKKYIIRRSEQKNIVSEVGSELF